MADMVAPKAGIHQAFAVADMTISQSLRSIGNLIQRPGILRIGFDDSLAALRGGGGRCLFGYGESDSDNRAHEALAQALKNPLMDRGRMLGEASRVLVQVAGGPAMTLSEVEILMRELNKHISDHTQLLFGTAVDGRMGDRLSVTLISSLACETDERPTQNFVPVKSFEPPPAHPVMRSPEPEIAVVQEAQEPEQPIEPAAAAPIVEPERVLQVEPTPFIQSLVPSGQITESEMVEAEPEFAREAEPAAEKTPPRIIPPKKKPVVAQKTASQRSPKSESPATMPVRIVGSGIGANLLECKLGNGAAPCFLDSAIFCGSTAPTWKSTAGIECSGSKLYSEKSSPPMVGSEASTFCSPNVLFQTPTRRFVNSGLL